MYIVASKYVKCQDVFEISFQFPLTCANCHKPALLQDFHATTPTSNEQKRANSSNKKDQTKTKTKAHFH